MFEFKHEFDKNERKSKKMKMAFSTNMLMALDFFAIIYSRAKKLTKQQTIFLKKTLPIEAGFFAKRNFKNSNMFLFNEKKGVSACLTYLCYFKDLSKKQTKFIISAFQDMLKIRKQKEKDESEKPNNNKS